jgi:hypothetical protein
MWLENPVRWGGLAAIVAGVMLGLSQLVRLYADVFDPSLFGRILAIDIWLGLILAVIVQLGLLGLYAPQANRVGLLGLLGFVLATAGTQLVMGVSFVFAFVRPVLWPWEDPEYFEKTLVSLALFGLTFALGWILLGVAALRSRVYPRIPTILLIAGSLILLIPLPLSDIIFAATVAWLGFVLFTARTREDATQPARPTGATGVT